MTQNKKLVSGCVHGISWKYMKILQPSIQPPTTHLIKFIFTKNSLTLYGAFWCSWYSRPGVTIILHFFLNNDFSEKKHKKSLKDYILWTNQPSASSNQKIGFFLGWNLNWKCPGVTILGLLAKNTNFGLKSIRKDLRVIRQKKSDLLTS